MPEASRLEHFAAAVAQGTMVHTLDAADPMTVRGSRELARTRDHVSDDPFVRDLLAVLLPAMAKPGQANVLFLDRIVLALTAHVAKIYGGVGVGRRLLRGGLAPWQERRAKELMSANLGDDMPLSRLAASCGLSVRHFARAFRQSTGVPPHRWLLKRRVERATELMNDRALPLADIAISCGFADQSHFTRVFTALVGVTPNAWRRTVGAAEELINGARSGA